MNRGFHPNQLNADGIKLNVSNIQILQSDLKQPNSIQLYSIQIIITSRTRNFVMLSMVLTVWQSKDPSQ